MERRVRMLISALLALTLILMPGVALAQWNGSQTITLEYDRQWATIYTGALNYSVNEYLRWTIVVDKHPTYGTDIDFSGTLYIPDLDLIYTTVGIRRGLFDSDTPTVAYLSVTFSF